MATQTVVAASGPKFCPGIFDDLNRMGAAYPLLVLCKQAETEARPLNRVPVGTDRELAAAFGKSPATIRRWRTRLSTGGYITARRYARGPEFSYRVRRFPPELEPLLIR